MADVYEALTSERPYRNAMSSHQALEIVRGDVPHRLDRAASEALQALADGDGLPDHDPMVRAGCWMATASSSLATTGRARPT